MEHISYTLNIFLKQQQQQKSKQKRKALPHYNNLQENLSLGYTKTEKWRRVLGKIFFVWFVIGLFETLICAKQKIKLW